MLSFFPQDVLDDNFPENFPTYLWYVGASNSSVRTQYSQNCLKGPPRVRQKLAAHDRYPLAGYFFCNLVERARKLWLLKTGDP